MISIIVPIYNGSIYIDTFIKSCEKQIFKDFEVIFVNDGSTDDTFKKLSLIKNNIDLNISIINQNNCGVSHARNTGIMHATREFLCFWDIDDEVSQYYLKEMLEAVSESSVDLVICKHKFIKKNGCIIENNEFKKSQTKIYDNDYILKEYLFSRIQSGCCTILVRRDIVLKNKLLFPEGYKYNEDLYNLWRFIQKSHKIAILDKELYFYKEHNQTAMTKFNEDRMHGLILMEKLNEFFRKENQAFYNMYRKYGASRIAWSLCWQAAIFNDYDHFILFIKKNIPKRYFIQLITYPQLKVSVSSIVMLISPKLFRFIALRFQPSRYRK